MADKFNEVIQKALEEGGLRKSTISAVAAAYNRTLELGK